MGACSTQFLSVCLCLLASLSPPPSLSISLFLSVSLTLVTAKSDEPHHSLSTVNLPEEYP